MPFVPFYAAQNLSAKVVAEDYPWNFIVPREQNWPLTVPKSDRRKLLLQPDAIWNCYTSFRGFNANQIVSGDNPAVGQRGIIYDYDAPTEDKAIDLAISKLPETIRPNYVETTHSNNRRLVWVMERELLIPNPAFGAALQEAFLNKLGGKTLLAGYDANSVKMTERWTNGSVWRLVKETPLPWEYCFGMLTEVGKRASLFERGEIPLNEIADEIRKRWPGRWEGEFSLNATGVRFWDEKADNPTGCQVKPDGMLCFTGTVPFMKWEKILGKPWCDERRIMNIGKAAEGIYYSGMAGYWENNAGKWDMMLRPSLIVRLKNRGLSAVTDKGETSSQVDKVIEYVERFNRVAGAAPMVNYRPGIVDFGDEKFLNTASLKFIVPVEGPNAHGDATKDFPFIAKVLLNHFIIRDQAGGRDPLCYWLTWLKVAAAAYPKFERVIGQAIFVCGPRNNGKTLVCNHIVGPMLGTPPSVGADPMDYLSGQTTFNKELWKYPLLAINDREAPRTEYDRARMLQNLKALIVNPTHSYHPKFCDKIIIPYTGRVYSTLNDDPSSVTLLPEVNDNTRDRMMFFATKKHPDNWPASQTQIEAQIARELPYFAWWLLNVYQPPDYTLDPSNRGGVASYFDPVILDLSRQQLYSYNLEELLRAWKKYAAYWTDESVKEWYGSPTELLTEMSQYDPLKSVVKEWTQQRIAKAMVTLAKQTGGAVEFSGDSGREFVIHGDKL